jgi:predicted DNA-binding protein (MmcQ/YjbR family)
MVQEGEWRPVTHKEVEEYLLSMSNAWLDYPFGLDVAVYKVGAKDGDKGEGKMFALVSEKKEPVQVSLKCDPQLAQTLRERYDTVMPGYHLNKKHWNTVVLTGELSEDEVKDLIRHSYQLVAGV